MCDNTRVVVNYLTVFFFKSINYYLLFTILWCIFAIIPRSNNLIQGIDFASIISWKEKLKKGTIETFLCLYSFLVSPSKTGSTYHNNGDPPGFWTLWKSFHTFVIHIDPCVLAPYYYTRTRIVALMGKIGDSWHGTVSFHRALLGHIAFQFAPVMKLPLEDYHWGGESLIIEFVER